MSSIFDGEDTIAGTIWIITSIAALNWATVEFADFDIVGEIVAATSPTVGTVLFAVIGAAGAVTLLDHLGMYNVTDVVDTLRGN